MMTRNVTIAFANQKGGTGKSTLCMLFSNYLAEKGVDLFVVDFDRQASIDKTRKSDEELLPDMDMPYGVQKYDLNVKPGNTEEEKQINDNYIIGVLKYYHTMVDVVVVDTPGNLIEDSLITLYQNVDYLIIPFSYDKVTWDGLEDFVKVTHIIRNDPFSKKFEDIFILNKYDPRVGTAEDHKLWEDMDAVLSNLGHFTPPIKSIADMTRINTFKLTKKQRLNVEECFNDIYNHIFVEGGNNE
jgi:chromosome partitioning protein